MLVFLLGLLILILKISALDSPILSQRLLQTLMYIIYEGRVIYIYLLQLLNIKPFYIKYG
jgi:hypothetical protein